MRTLCLRLDSSFLRISSRLVSLNNVFCLFWDSPMSNRNALASPSPQSTSAFYPRFGDARLLKFLSALVVSLQEGFDARPFQ